MNKYIWLTIIIVIAAFCRLWQLNSLPYGTANDEVSYIYSAYTIWETGGHDVAGKYFPLSINLDSSLSPVPVYLIAPFVGLFGLSPLTGRLPFALVGIGSVIILYFLVSLLLKNEKIALLSSFVMAVSPWAIFASRGVWDGDMAIFFYLIGIYIFIKYVKKGNILWSIPAFLLGFYSYHGMKVFFLALIPLLIIIYWKQLWEKKKQSIIFLSLCFCIFLSFYIVTVTQGVSRQQQALMWSDPKSVSDTVSLVKYYRGKSTAPYIFREIVSNKLTISLQKMINNYLEAFSPQFLFINGDINPIYSYGIFLKGVLYIIELPLLIIGLLYLVKRSDKKSTYFIIVSLLLAPLPSAIGSGTTYIIRAMMMIPFIAVLIGSGIYYIFDLTKKIKLYSFLAYIIIICGYFLCISYFFYQYIFEFNTSGADFWNASSRTAATVIKQNTKLYKNIYVFNSDDKFLFQFLFYNKINPALFQRVWRTENTIRKIGNITFFPNCIHQSKDKPLEFLPNSTLALVYQGCNTITSKKTITDSTEPLQIIWNIYAKN